MRGISLVLIVWLGCRPAQPPPSFARELVGIWGNQGSGGSEPCQKVSMEFRDDGTMFVRTGRQTLTGTYSVERGPSRLVVQQRNVQSNGEPNCQGTPAEFVLQHYLYRIYVDVHGDTLRIYRAPGDEDPFLTTIRVR
jgi:hypothetical protein